MSGADLADPEVIRVLRQQVAKGLDAALVALGGSVHALTQMQECLVHERLPACRRTVQRCDEAFSQARQNWLEAEAEVHRAQRGRGGGRQSSDEERRLMLKAQRAREAAEARLKHIQQWIVRLQRDGAPLRHQVRDHDLVIRRQQCQAVAELDHQTERIETYLRGNGGPTP